MNNAEDFRNYAEARDFPRVSAEGQLARDNIRMSGGALT